jgi:hypothetical protein
VSFRQPADLFGADDRNVVSGEGAAGHGAGLPIRPGDPGLADQVGDLLVERAVFGATNITNTLVRPNNARASCSPKTAPSCRHVCAAYIKDTPSARSLAIRVRSVGSGAVDGNSSKQASIGGHNRPHPDLLASINAVSNTCSATAVINGEAEAYGSSRPNR